LLGAKVLGVRHNDSAVYEGHTGVLRA